MQAWLCSHCSIVVRAESQPTAVARSWESPPHEATFDPAGALGAVAFFGAVEFDPPFDPPPHPPMTRAARTARAARVERFISADATRPPSPSPPARPRGEAV